MHTWNVKMFHCTFKCNLNSLTEKKSCRSFAFMSDIHQFDYGQLNVSNENNEKNCVNTTRFWLNMHFIEWIEKRYKKCNPFDPLPERVICHPRPFLFDIHVHILKKSSHSIKKSAMMNCFPICMSMIKSSTKAQLFRIQSDNGGVFFSLEWNSSICWKLVPNIAFILNNSCKHIHGCIATMTWIYVLFRIYKKE